VGLDDAVVEVGYGTNVAEDGVNWGRHGGVVLAWITFSRGLISSLTATDDMAQQSHPMDLRRGARTSTAEGGTHSCRARNVLAFLALETGCRGLVLVHAVPDLLVSDGQQRLPQLSTDALYTSNREVEKVVRKN
jgi:hypothetical protein